MELSPPPVLPTAAPAPCTSESVITRTTVIIPALNEEAALPGVLRSLRALGLPRVVVVDNGSTDRTSEVAREHGAAVLSEPLRGYGAACWCGMLALDPAAEWVLFCDADGSDDLRELPRFFQAAADGADFVLGDRRATQDGRRAMTPQQGFGNALATTLIALGWHHRYHDLGPLRLIGRAALDRIAMRDRGFGWTVEMQVRAVEEGVRIAEIPVGYHRRQGGRSKISGTIRGSVHAGVIILFTLGRLWFHRLRMRTR